MRQAVRRPRHGLKSRGFNPAPVDDALAERAVLDSPQGIINLLEERCIEFPVSERFARDLVGYTLLPRVTRDVTRLFTANREFLSQVDSCALAEPPKSVFIVLQIHVPPSVTQRYC